MRLERQWRQRGSGECGESLCEGVIGGEDGLPESLLHMAMQIDLASQERILGDLGGRDEGAEWRGKYCVLSAKKSTRKQELRLQGRAVISAGHHG